MLKYERKTENQKMQTNLKLFIFKFTNCRTLQVAVLSVPPAFHTPAL